jgi:hypothetical protein
MLPLLTPKEKPVRRDVKAATQRVLLKISVAAHTRVLGVRQGAESLENACG